MLQTLVQSPDRVLLGHDLATVVLDHSVAFMLQPLVLGLGLDELSLKLLHLFWVASGTCERLTKISPDRPAMAGLESRAEGRLRSPTVAANLGDADFVSIRDPRVARSLQVSSDHLRQVPNDLCQVGSIRDLILDVRQ